MSMVLVYNKHSNIIDKEDNTSLIEDEEKARHTIYWIEADNRFSKLYPTYDGKYYTYEYGQPVYTYRISWGYDETFSLGSELIIRDYEENNIGYDTNGRICYEKQILEGEDTEYAPGEDFVYNEWCFTLDDALFADKSKDIYVQITGISASETSIMHVIPKEQKIVKGLYDGDYYSFYMDESKYPEIVAPEEGELANKALYYYVYYKDSNNQFVRYNFSGSNPRFSQTCKLSDNYFGKYNDPENSGLLGTIYIQPVYMNTTKEFINNYLYNPTVLPCIRNSVIIPETEYYFEQFCSSVAVTEDGSYLLQGGNVTYGPITEYSFYKEDIISTVITIGDCEVDISIDNPTSETVNSGLISINLNNFRDSQGNDIQSSYDWISKVSYYHPSFGTIDAGIHTGTQFNLTPGLYYLIDIYGCAKVSSESNIHIRKTLDTTAPIYDTNAPSIISNYVSSGFEDFGGTTLYPQILSDYFDSIGYDSLKVKYYITPTYFDLPKNNTAEIIEQYPCYESSSIHIVNDHWTAPIPLYMFENNKKHGLVCYAEDANYNYSYNRFNNFQWKKLDGKPITAVASTTETIGFGAYEYTNTKYTLNVRLTLPIETYDNYFWTSENYNVATNKWENNTRGTNFPQHEIIDNHIYLTQENITLYSTGTPSIGPGNVFMRYTGKYEIINPDLSATYYFSAPSYFWSEGIIENNYKMMYQSTSGVKLEIDQPTYVHTVYANRNLGNNIDNWEIQGFDIQQQLLTPAVNGSKAEAYYFVDTDNIPDDHYYVTIAYFTDGTSTMTMPILK